MTVTQEILETQGSIKRLQNKITPLQAELDKLHSKLIKQEFKKFIQVNKEKK